MSHEANVHQIQTHILRELLFVPHASFSELQKPTGLDGDHFKFHVQRLVDIGYIEKIDRGQYKLTTSGKEYANKLDTDQNTIERQPKSAVILVIEKTIDGEQKLLVQERLKHPYYGFWGFAGGKIRWGETIIEAGQRELLEETGLSADLTYRGVYHEHVVEKETDKLLEDKIFHVLHGVDPTGEMLQEFEGGRNAWLTQDEVDKLDKKYDSFETERRVGLGKVSFVELTQYYSKNQF
ncbi:MAG: NUDIX domain-containing protein [Candidatus Saccharibacteria bacterium]|nr:NUDIX domain-containing protein [Candidatus Saccharibacteria bacterium]